MLLAYAIIGIISISVMEGVSEMIQLFPAPNAVVEYVKAFVDVDLAWVIGIAYWYVKSLNRSDLANGLTSGTHMLRSSQR
jgi:yeast amino acid transporter